MIETRQHLFNIDTLKFVDVNQTEIPVQAEWAQCQKWNSSFVIAGTLKQSITLSNVEKVRGTGRVPEVDEIPSTNVEFEFRCGEIELESTREQVKFVVKLITDDDGSTYIRRVV